jgi:hypothetical protein
MTGLPWVRLDSNFGTHDKIAPLQQTADGRSAIVLYVCALGYSGGHGTDGMIPRHALKFIAPGLPKAERLAVILVESRLWDYTDGGWQIHNYEHRQELAVVTEGKRAMQRKGAEMTNCKRKHGPDCGCWRDKV